MKKLFAIFFAFAVLAAPRAVSQDKMMFNHMSLGVSVGLVEGVGVDIAMPIGPKFQFRAGYNTLDPILGAIKVEGSPLNDFSTALDISYHGNGMDIDKIGLQAAAKYSHAEFLFDFFPARGVGFHLTAGAMFAFNPLVHAEGTAQNASGANGIPKSDWANTTFFGISTDTNGKVQADLQFGLNTVKPYIGLGFGRPVSLEHRVGFNFDLGLQITGGLHLYSYDYTSGSAQPVEINSEWINKYEDVRAQAGSYTDYLDLVNTLPVWPVMRFSLFVRLF